MNKKAIALGACVIVASATAMPVSLSAAELNMPTNVAVKEVKSAETGEPLDLEITLKAEGAEDVISGLEVTVECEGQEPTKVTSGENGVLKVNLPKYGTYKLTSQAPEGYTAGLESIIIYSAESRPDPNMVLTLKKECEDVRPVVIKHVDSATKEVLKGGKGQLLDAKTKEVVVKDIDLKGGEIAVGDLKVDGSYVFEWLEEVNGYKSNTETNAFSVVKGEGTQYITLESTASEEKAEEVNVMFELQDFTSKETLTTGKAMVKQVGGDKSFELDFSKAETLTQTLVSGEEYEFEITEVPEGYVVPQDQETTFKVANQDGKGGMIQPIYVMSQEDLGSAESVGLPETGAVATAGAGIAGLSVIGAFLVKRFKK